jgi:serine/threonine protein kinase
MNKLENEYIVRFYDSFQAQNKLNIVMELCENGDLGQFLKR